MNRGRFVALTTIGSAAWVALIAGLGYAAGSNWKHVAKTFACRSTQSSRSSCWYWLGTLAPHLCRCDATTPARPPGGRARLRGVTVGAHVVPGVFDLPVGPMTNVERMTPMTACRRSSFRPTPRIEP